MSPACTVDMICGSINKELLCSCLSYVCFTVWLRVSLCVCDVGGTSRNKLLSLRTYNCTITSVLIQNLTLSQHPLSAFSLAHPLVFRHSLAFDGLFTILFIYFFIYLTSTFNPILADISCHDTKHDLWEENAARQKSEEVLLCAQKTHFTYCCPQARNNENIFIWELLSICTYLVHLCTYWYLCIFCINRVGMW